VFRLNGTGLGEDAFGAAGKYLRQPVGQGVVAEVGDAEEALGCGEGVVAEDGDANAIGNLRGPRSPPALRVG